MKLHRWADVKWEVFTPERASMMHRLTDDVIPKIKAQMENFGKPHRWERRSDADARDDHATWQCAGCRKWVVALVAVPKDHAARAVAEHGYIEEIGGLCGIPNLNEDWSADGFSGHVTLIHHGVSFSVRSANGEVRNFEWGTLDETPISEETT